MVRDQVTIFHVFRVMQPNRSTPDQRSALVGWHNWCRAVRRATGGPSDPTSRRLQEQSYKPSATAPGDRLHRNSHLHDAGPRNARDRVGSSEDPPPRWPLAGASVEKTEALP
jgi:hypothetical protein